MQPSEDERVLAALSHASIVANVVNLVGMIATALIWTMQRDRSTYVRTHALQALVYQGAALLISIFLGLFGALCLALSLLPVMVRPDLYRGSLPSYSVWIGVLALLALIGFGVLATAYGLYAAYQAYRGRPFRYPVIGRLARPLAVPTPVPNPSPAPAAPAEAAVAPIAAAPIDDIPQPDPAPPANSSPAPPAAPPAPKRRSRRAPPGGEA